MALGRQVVSQAAIRTVETKKSRHESFEPQNFTREHQKSSLMLSCGFCAACSHCRFMKHICCWPPHEKMRFHVQTVTPSHVFLHHHHIFQTDLPRHFSRDGNVVISNTAHSLSVIVCLPAIRVSLPVWPLPSDDACQSTISVPPGEQAATRGNGTLA